VTAVPTTVAKAPNVSSAEAGVRPHFDAVACPDDVTSDVVVSLSCGYLTVLEDRSRPNGRTIQVFVVRLDPPGGTTTADPVVILGHLASQDGYGAMAAGGQRTHRVEYLIDPRGIGHSQPSLDCPEVVAAGPALAGLRLRDAARRATTLGAVRACHDRLVSQGIDLGAYGLAANAEDLEDLRTTLGIASWNLITNGSASRLAFEVAGRYPMGLRSLFIDSPSLPEPNLATIGPVALDLSISRLVAMCAAQAVCAHDYPDPDEMIRDAEVRLDATPLTFAVGGTVAAIQLGHPIQVIVDGAALVRWIRSSIGAWAGSQSAEVLATVQAVLDGTLSGDSAVVSSLSTDAGDCLGILTSCERPNLGALYSIVCKDLAGRIDRSRLDASIDGRPSYADAFAPGPLIAACDGWPVGGQGPSPAGSLTGGVPTMIMRGALDPFSAPMTDVSEAAAHVGNVFLLEVPNQSYNVLGFRECPVAIRNAWIDAPTSPPADTSCLEQIPAIDLTP
jgi:pimeloyl-ACP methyl ester carboxylesterase